MESQRFYEEINGCFSNSQDTILSLWADALDDEGKPEMASSLRKIVENGWFPMLAADQKRAGYLPQNYKERLAWFVLPVEVYVRLKATDKTPGLSESSDWKMFPTRGDALLALAAIL